MWNLYQPPTWDSIFFITYPFIRFLQRNFSPWQYHAEDLGGNARWCERSPAVAQEDPQWGKYLIRLWIWAVCALDRDKLASVSNTSRPAYARTPSGSIAMRSATAGARKRTKKRWGFTPVYLEGSLWDCGRGRTNYRCILRLLFFIQIISFSRTRMTRTLRMILVRTKRTPTHLSLLQQRNGRRSGIRATRRRMITVMMPIKLRKLTHREHYFVNSLRRDTVRDSEGRCSDLNHSPILQTLRVMGSLPIFKLLRICTPKPILDWKVQDLPRFLRGSMAIQITANVAFMRNLRTRPHWKVSGKQYNLSLSSSSSAKRGRSLSTGPVFPVGERVVGAQRYIHC